MKTHRAKKLRGILCALSLGAAALALNGCADGYAGYPGYGGYYASYSGYRPYYNGYPYGYGYASYPYRSYGPYYGRPYYAPYGAGGAVVVSSSRTYRYR